MARFQEREADQGRPVAVIVTSRTAVADRARIPFSELAAVKLESFDAALAQSDLARQPLLLLLLAFYDAGTGTGLRESDLYERVFRRFAQREVRKEQPALAGDRRGAAVEAELLRLSLTAFSEGANGSPRTNSRPISPHWAWRTPAPPADAGFQQPLTSAQIVAGRFFFVHRSEATVGARRLTTLEFLIARLVVRELGELAAASALRSRRTTDDRFLAALLSFTPLTGRENFVRLFLGDLVADLGAAEKERIGRVVIDLLQQVDTRDGWNRDGFGPERAGLPHRTPSPRSSSTWTPSARARPGPSAARAGRSGRRRTRSSNSGARRVIPLSLRSTTSTWRCPESSSRAGRRATWSAGTHSS
ncbi:hypothetical protein [Actinomadura chokoriensis]|uniref:hypothetical protein n=1 Tax=Actinomadura chokoriensis TaxID=454156 RepID=UPI0031F99824